jgi:hypothetical protein
MSVIELVGCWIGKGGLKGRVHAFLREVEKLTLGSWCHGDEGF